MLNMKTVLHLKALLIRLTALVISICMFPCHADDIERLLKAKEPPPGVVFEIIEDAPDDLESIMTRTVAMIKRLRNRFPDMEFAVVSHGPELFALQRKYSKEYSRLHETVRSLDKQDIKVHVCETYAGWSRVMADQFPDYVDVAPVGPVQIKNYQALGFYKIQITKSGD